MVVVKQGKGKGSQKGENEDLLRTKYQALSSSSYFLTFSKFINFLLMVLPSTLSYTFFQLPGLLTLLFYSSHRPEHNMALLHLHVGHRAQPAKITPLS